MGAADGGIREPALENLRWRKIPGCGGAEVFPVLRKPDASCSNAYLLQSAHFLVAVDPGADEAQAARICEILQSRFEERPRPVLVLLTHCHRDHSWQMGRLAARLEGLPVRLMAQEAGARALQEQDGDLTLAYLFKEDPPQTGPVIPLLPESDRAASGEWTIPLAGDYTIRARTANYEAGDARLDGLALCLGGEEGEDWLHLYRAPGHSPDSVVIVAGRLALTGDLHYAANPGVAGVIGWDQAALLRSLAGVARLIRERGVELCCPGHGAPLPAAKALQLLESARARAAELSDAVRLDADRVHYLRDYALAALAEAADLFTLIGGRLYSLAYQMERLEEPEEARRILEALDIAAIDTCLTDFQRFAESFDASSLEIGLPLRGLQAVSKIEAALSVSGGGINGLIEPSLARRARRLLADFVNTLRGLPALDRAQPEDVNQWLARAFEEARERDTAWRGMVDSAEDPAAFARALAENIARQTVLARAPLSLDAQPGLPPALVDGEYLADGVTALLERLAARGAERILIQTSLAPEGGWIQIRISAPPLTRLESLFSACKIRFLRSAFQRCGHTLVFDPSTQPESILLSLPAAPAR